MNHRKSDFEDIFFKYVVVQVVNFDRNQELGGKYRLSESLNYKFFGQFVFFFLFSHPFDDIKDDMELLDFAQAVATLG